MKSIIKERYTIETLSAKNITDARERKITLHEVNTANQYVDFIESTRSETIPNVGDRIRMTTKDGDYYHEAHIEKMREYGFLVCERGSVPYMHNPVKGLSFFTGGGGAWLTVKLEDLVYVGKEMKTFRGPIHTGIATFDFDAEVSVWEYKEPGVYYGNFSTKDWRRIYVRELNEKEAKEAGFEMYGTGISWRSKQEFDEFIQKFKGTVFPGNWYNQQVVWCYREERDGLCKEEWDKLELPIGTEHINGKRVAKIRIDDETKTVYHYFITNE